MHAGAGSGVGHGASSLDAVQRVDEVPFNTKPCWHENIPVLPCRSPFVLVMVPLVGASAPLPVQVVAVWWVCVCRHMASSARKHVETSNLNKSNTFDKQKTISHIENREILIKVKVYVNPLRKHNCVLSVKEEQRSTCAHGQAPAVVGKASRRFRS